MVEAIITRPFKVDPTSIKYPSFTPPPPPCRHLHLSSFDNAASSGLMPDALDSHCAAVSCPLLLRCQCLLTANLSPSPPPVPFLLVLRCRRLLTTNLSASCCADACSPPAPWPLSFVSHPPLIASLWFGWLSGHFLSRSPSCSPVHPPLSLSTGDYATCPTAALSLLAPQPPVLRRIPPPPAVRCKLIVVLLSCRG